MSVVGIKQNIDTTWNVAVNCYSRMFAARKENLLNILMFKFYPPSFLGQPHFRHGIQCEGFMRELSLKSI